MGIISELNIRLALRKPLARINSALKQLDASSGRIGGTSLEGEMLAKEMLAKGFTPRFIEDFDEVGHNLDKHYNAVFESERLSSAMISAYPGDFLADYPKLKVWSTDKEIPLLALHKDFAGLIDESPVGKAFKEYSSRKPIEPNRLWEISNVVPSNCVNRDFWLKAEIEPESKALLLLAKDLLRDEYHLDGALSDILRLARTKKEWDSLKTEARGSPLYVLLSGTDFRRNIDGAIFEKEREVKSRELARKAAGYISTHYCSVGNCDVKGILRDYRDGVYRELCFDLGRADDRRRLVELLDSNAEILAKAADAPERYARKFLMAKEKLDRHGLDCFDSYLYDKDLGDKVVRLFSEDLVKGTEAYRFHRYR